MAFAPVLNSYCAMLDCSNKELAQRSGLSDSALSRYRSGKRTPRTRSDIMDRLAQAIVEMAAERGMGATVTKEAVKEALAEGVIHSKPLGPSFSMRLDSIMKLLRIKNVEVAIPLHLDSSYISRIRRGERTPNDKRRFAEVVAQVAALSCMERGLLKELLVLMGAENELVSLDELNVDSALGLAEYIGRWLLGNQILEADVAAVESLFRQFDSMARGEDTPQVPAPSDLVFESSPMGEAEIRFYQGKDFIWQAEVEFLQSIVKSGVKQLYLSSDMPGLEKGLSGEQAELYRQLLFELVNNGCHITIVHDASRPLRESAVAMRLWAPLYMTGSVTPLFLEGVSSPMFCHVNNVCEYRALSGEAIRGHEEDGRYFCTSLPEQLDYYHKKMMLILEKTSVLFEIYRSDDEEGMRKFERDEAQRQATGRTREVHQGVYQNLRILLHQGDCIVLFLDSPLNFRFVIRHPKLLYLVSQMS